MKPIDYVLDAGLADDVRAEVARLEAEARSTPGATDVHAYGVGVVQFLVVVADKCVPLYAAVRAVNAVRGELGPLSMSWVCAVPVVDGVCQMVAQACVEHEPKVKKRRGQPVLF